MARRTRHIPLSTIDVVKYRVIDLIEESQRLVSILSHFSVLVCKIYAFRNQQFLSSYIGYYLSLILIFCNYMYFLHQSGEDIFQNPTFASYGSRFESTVDLNDHKFVIDNFEKLESYKVFYENFKRVCKFSELVILNRNTSKLTKLNSYMKLKQTFGQQMLGRMWIDSDARQTNFTIEIDNYQLTTDYFHDFPFVNNKFNLFEFPFGLVKSHFIDVHNCIVQSLLKEYSLDDVILFRLYDLNGLIGMKMSFFYYLPLIISIGWLPNCLSIAGEKLKVQNSDIRRFYRICGLDTFTYHLAYTIYIFISLFFQTIIFVIILHIINLPYHFSIHLKPNNEVIFYRKLIDSKVFVDVMICYNLAIALHVQLFSLLYRSRTHFYISFTIYTFFTSQLPFALLSDHIRVPFQTTFASQQLIDTKFIIVYSTFLLCPNAALTYALRQIEDMSHIERSRQSITDLRTFESLAYNHITINDVIDIFLTYSTLSLIVILNHELGSWSVVKILFLDFFKSGLEKLYCLTIRDTDKQLLFYMNDFSARLDSCTCSMNNETHLSCVNELKRLNMQAKSNEIIVILSNKHKAKEFLFKSILGETQIRSGEFYVDMYRMNSFIKPLFINRYATSSIGVCFEEDIFDNQMTLEENLIIYSKLQSSQFVANISDIVLLIHLLKLKDVKRVPVNLTDMNIKRKLAVAVALLGTHRILVLNEPTKGTDHETSKLIFETLVKLKHDKLIIILSTNPRLNFHSYADQLYVLNDSRLLHVGTLHQLMNATHSGIHLIFRKVNRMKKVKIEQMDNILAEYFGEKEFALVSRDVSRLIWYSYNISLIDLLGQFRMGVNRLSQQLNLYLERIKINRMKLNLNANYLRSEPIPYEQNTNIFFIGPSRARPVQSPPVRYSLNWFKDFVYCLKLKLFTIESMLINFLVLIFIFVVCIYFLNVYEFFDIVPWLINHQFFTQMNRSKTGDFESFKPKALDFSSSAILDNLMVYVIETKRDEFRLTRPKLHFKTKDLVSFLNRSLSEALNTHQFLCIQLEDSFDFVHREKIDTILIEKHLGGIMRLDYKSSTTGLTVDLVHNSHFPYLLLQIINLFTNFLITKTANFDRTGHRTNRTQMPFRVNLQLNEIKALHYLYKNLTHRIMNFFLLTCVFFLLSIFLNENIRLYFNRRISIITRTKRMKFISTPVYWISNLFADYLVGILSWSGILIIVITINLFYNANFFDFSLIFCILYFFVLTASLIFLYYIIYLSTNSLKSYLVVVAEICFVFGFALPLLFSNLQYYSEKYYFTNKSWLSFFNILIYLNSLISPIFNFVWTIDKIQFYHWDLRLCEKLDSSLLDSFCPNKNMTDYNYIINLPMSIDRIYKCCSSKDLVYTYYLNDIFITSFPLILLNCILTGFFLVFIDGMDSVTAIMKLKH